MDLSFPSFRTRLFSVAFPLVIFFLTMLPVAMFLVAFSLIHGYLQLHAHGPAISLLFHLQSGRPPARARLFSCLLTRKAPIAVAFIVARLAQAFSDCCLGMVTGRTDPIIINSV